MDEITQGPIPYRARDISGDKPVAAHHHGISSDVSVHQFMSCGAHRPPRTSTSTLTGREH